MPQTLHPDFETNADQTEYFFLGTGKVLAAIQWSRNPSLTPVGLLISNPERFARKWSTQLFHPEHGLAKTEITIILDGKRYRPTHETTSVEWEFGTGVPTVHVKWQADDIEVHERFWSAIGEPSIIREVEAKGVETRSVQIETALYATPALHDWFGSGKGFLEATGVAYVSIHCDEDSSVNERTMIIHGRHATLRYALQSGEPSVANAKTERSYWQKTTQLLSDGPVGVRLVAQYQKACMGLRAVIAENGRFDASIWQYGFEWTGDAANVAEALVYSGQFELAKSVLNNILTRLSNDKGMVMESSRFRGGADSELNSNGAVLKACQTYSEWTGDKAFLRHHFQRIAAIANYLLRPEYYDEKRGLVLATRDIWERNAALGILPGYDTSHQTYSILGWNAAAAIAIELGEDGSKWGRAAERMKDVFLDHPTHSMLEQKRIIKRRLVDGGVQHALKVDESESNSEFLKEFRPKGSPLYDSTEAAWEPDSSEVFPICFGIVDPNSDVARNTMQEIEKLWSQDWKGGGYGRYNVASEPDSPGPWPFATGFIAAAYLEMGDLPRAMQGIAWLIEKAGAAGSWFEFYGDRPTPPLPPTGIIVWGWAQWITLVVRHVLNARVIDGEMRIDPRIEGIEAAIRFCDTVVYAKSFAQWEKDLG